MGTYHWLACSLCQIRRWCSINRKRGVSHQWCKAPEDLQKKTLSSMAQFCKSQTVSGASMCFLCAYCMKHEPEKRRRYLKLQEGVSHIDGTKDQRMKSSWGKGIVLKLSVPKIRLIRLSSRGNVWVQRAAINQQRLLLYHQSFHDHHQTDKWTTLY